MTTVDRKALITRFAQALSNMPRDLFDNTTPVDTYQDPTSVTDPHGRVVGAVIRHIMSSNPNPPSRMAYKAIIGAEELWVHVKNPDPSNPTLNRQAVVEAYLQFVDDPDTMFTRDTQVLPDPPSPTDEQ